MELATLIEWNEVDGKTTTESEVPVSQKLSNEDLVTFLNNLKGLNSDEAGTLTAIVKTVSTTQLTVRDDRNHLFVILLIWQ